MPSLFKTRPENWISLFFGALIGIARTYCQIAISARQRMEKKTMKQMLIPPIKEPDRDPDPFLVTLTPPPAIPIDDPFLVTLTPPPAIPIDDPF